MKFDIFDLLLLSGFYLSIVLINKYTKRSTFNGEVFEICETLNNVDIFRGSETEE